MIERNLSYSYHSYQILGWRGKNLVVYMYYRLELRFPDPSANPYLALTAIIGAGLNGIDAEIEPDPKLRVQEEM